MRVHSSRSNRVNTSGFCTAALLLLVAYGGSTNAQSSNELDVATTPAETSGATAVAAALIKAGDTGSAPYTLKIIKNGEARPQASNTTTDGRAQNRRVDVKVFKTEAPDQELRESAEVEGGGIVWVTRDPASLDKLLTLDVPATIPVSDGTLVKPMDMRVLTNYPDFIDRVEVRFYRYGEVGVARPLQVLEAQASGAETQVSWDGRSGISSSQLQKLIARGEELELEARVYDSKGNFDATFTETVRFVDADSAEDAEATASSRSEQIAGAQDRSLERYALDFENLTGPDDADSGYEPLAQEGIAVAGAKVRVHGANLGIESGFEEVAFVNGERYNVNENGEFIAEFLLPAGEHEFTVAANGDTPEASGYSEKLRISVDSNYFFMVGMADVTAGANDVSGSIEPLAVDAERYGGDIFVDGRLAFYLKGKIQGKYLVTAQLDTGTEDVSELFDDFNRKDPQSVFRRLDPEQYYLVYGDDSSLYDDTDSQGKFYLRVEWDRSHVLWGNFNTSFTGAELAPFNRSLYGLRALHRSLGSTASGDSKTEVSAFVSEAQTASRHNEFLGTGGSLYYLRDQDIVLGSEKVVVEVRRNGSEQVVESIPLVAGRDYDIDEFQGRLILRRPLLGVAAQSGPSIIRDEPLDGDSVLLVVDYEYLPDDFNADNLTAGFRGRQWLGDHVGVGVTWANEQRDGDDYDIKGVDLTLKKSEHTYIRAEVAHSESNQTAGSFVSTDGGLSFTEFNSNDGVGSGNAVSIEAQLNLDDLTDSENSSSPLAGRSVQAGVWYKQRDAGFSTPRHDSGADTVDAGVEVSAEPNERLGVSARATTLARDGIDTETTIAMQGDYTVTDRLEASAELRFIDLEDEDVNSAGSGDSSATLAAGRLAYDLTSDLNVYGVAQATLNKSGNYEDNNRFALGAEYTLSDRLRLNGEVNTGDRGDGVLAGAEWVLSDSYSIYSNLSHETLTAGNSTQSLTLGQRKQFSRRLKIYSEHQFTHEDERQGASHTLGLDHSFTRYLSGSFSVQFGEFDDDTGNRTDRNAISVGIDYARNTLKAASRIEYRQDESSTINSDQWVVTNRFEYQPDASLRWQGLLNASRTIDNVATETEASFVEAGIGFALRPVAHDRLNMLGRLTYIQDLPPQSQSTEPDRRSIIASFEGIYELSHHWSVGGKLAYRDGSVRLQREDGSWIGNDASLAALRLHYRVPFGLELLGGWRWLGSDETSSTRQGALLSVGGEVHNNLRLSVGYNFTEFDDDLTNDSNDVRGWFINLVGKY